MGVNIAEAIAPSPVSSSWDLRIPLITDDNFDEIIVHEQLMPKEEAKRVWLLIMYVALLYSKRCCERGLNGGACGSSMAAGQNSAISKLVDQQFDEAYNQTLAAGDLPYVRWGRVDYNSVTFLTTKWCIWSCVTMMCTPRHLRD